MFTRYKSIENTYQEKFIRDMLQYNPVYHTCKYVAQEKIHGANFQINLNMEETGAVSIGYGKRSGFLADDSDFYNYQATVQKPEYQELIELVCDKMRKEDLANVTLYGEFAGPTVQKGVNYGDTKFVIFFDIKINDEYITPLDFYSLMDGFGFRYMCVPIVKIFDTLNEALAFEVENRISIVGVDEEDNFWEGVVIKPWDCIALNKHLEQVLFYIKKKCEAFKAKANAKKRGSRDAKADEPLELTNAKEEFELYLTENRLNDVLGHHGMITDKSQMGTYIKYMMNDAKEDFLKDNMDLFNSVPDKHKGKIFSITGKIVSKLLFKYI